MNKLAQKTSLHVSIYQSFPTSNRTTHVLFQSLNRISEPRLTLDNLLPFVRLSVTVNKEQTQTTQYQPYQQVGRHASPNTRYVCRRILRPEHKTTCDATDAAKANQRGAAEGTLPLTADVVGLVGHDGGNVCVGASGDEEDAKVGNSVAGVVAQDGKADNAEKGVKGKDWRTHVVAVADPGG